MTEVVLRESYKSKEIIPCRHCKSTGINERDELTCYYRNDYDYWNELCSHCEGEGRVVEITLTTLFDLRHVEISDAKRHQIKETFTEALKGRTTGDIYKIGRNP